MESENSSHDNGTAEHSCKVLVVGETTVGKTSLIQRLISNRFSPLYKATIGVDFQVKEVISDRHALVKLCLWDISGVERLGSFLRVYYKQAKAAFVVFDVSKGQQTSDKGMAFCVKWKRDLDDKVRLADGRPIPVVLLANKHDRMLAGDEPTTEQIRQFAEDNGFAGWFYTSAKDGTNLEEAAMFLIGRMFGEGILGDAAQVDDAAEAVPDDGATDYNQDLEKRLQQQSRTGKEIRWMRKREIDKPLDWRGAVAVASWLVANSTVLVLDLTAHNIKSKGAIALAESLRHNVSIIALYLGGNDIGSDGAKALAAVLNVPAILHTDSSSSSNRHGRLRTLAIPNNAIGNEGMAALANALKNNYMLAELDVSGNMIGKDGVAALADALQFNSSLAKINLADNPLGDLGAMEVAKALQSNGSLRTVDLHAAAITSAGAGALIDGFKTNKTVTALPLLGNAIFADLLSAIKSSIAANENANVFFDAGGPLSVKSVTPTTRAIHCTRLDAAQLDSLLAAPLAAPVERLVILHTPFANRTAPAFLSNFAATLVSLSLINCNLGSVGFLSGFANLRQVNLAGNMNITDANALFATPWMQLASKFIIEIACLMPGLSRWYPPVDLKDLNWRPVAELNLSHSQLRVEEFPAALEGFLARLKVLNLSHNNLTVLPAWLDVMADLNLLDISYNNIDLVPTSLQRLLEKRPMLQLKIEGNPFVARVFGISFNLRLFSTDADLIRSTLMHYGSDSVTPTTFNVVVVGPFGGGKTTLVRALTGGSLAVDPGDKGRTLGIDVTEEGGRWFEWMRFFPGMRVKFFDFSGQKQFLVMQELLFQAHSSTIIILLLDLTRDEPLEAQATPWMRLLAVSRGASAPRVPLFVCGNCKGNAMSQRLRLPLNRLAGLLQSSSQQHGRYHVVAASGPAIDTTGRIIGQIGGIAPPSVEPAFLFEQVKPNTAEEWDAIEDFRHRLNLQMTALQQRRPKIPYLFNLVRTALLEICVKDNVRHMEFARTCEVVRQMIKKKYPSNALFDDRLFRDAVKYLNEAGYVLHVPKLVINGAEKDMIFFDRADVCQRVLGSLTSPLQDNFLSLFGGNMADRLKGAVSRTQLVARLSRLAIDPDVCLALLRHFALVAVEESEESDTLIFPSLIQCECPEVVQAMVAAERGRAAVIVGRDIRCVKQAEFLPYGLMPRVQSRLATLIGSQTLCNLWTGGLRAMVTVPSDGWALTKDVRVVCTCVIDVQRRKSVQVVGWNSLPASGAKEDVDVALAAVRGVVRAVEDCIDELLRDYTEMELAKYIVCAHCIRASEKVADERWTAGTFDELCQAETCREDGSCPSRWEVLYGMTGIPSSVPSSSSSSSSSSPSSSSSSASSPSSAQTNGHVIETIRPTIDVDDIDRSLTDVSVLISSAIQKKTTAPVNTAPISSLLAKVKALRTN